MAKKKKKKLAKKRKKPAWMNVPYYRPMEPYEYEMARIHFDLPSTRFAFMLGVGWRQGQRYRDGRVAIPAPVAKLIRTAIRCKLRPRDLDD